VAGTGNELNNALKGNTGGNTLSGLAGNDFLDGGAGNDRLIGGAGKDALTGGAGRDIFVFANGDFAGKTATSADSITDFSHAQLDKIDLSAVDANLNVAGDQAFTFVGTAAFTGVGQLHVETINGVSFLTGNTGGDLAADFAVKLDNAPTLVASDFVL
jgi:Ca2+-binding RTX toxin-like protein